MAIATFYHPQLEENQRDIELSAEESTHAIKSRRLRIDDPVQIINGRGLIATGRLSAIYKKQVAVELTSFDRPIKAKAITIAVAVPKGERQRVMVDMLTQLGVGRIIPLQCDRSITKFNSAHRQKWQRVAVEACKQAQNPWVPQIDELQTIEQVLGEKNGLKLFADKDGRALSTINVIEPLTCLVGPEGGFSPNEYAKFAKNGVESAGLSKHILRIELAAITMMTQATAVNDV